MEHPIRIYTEKDRQVAHRPDLPQQPLDTQFEEGTHPLGHIADERVDDTRSRRTRTVARRLNAVTDVLPNCLAIHTKPGGNGRDVRSLPMQFLSTKQKSPVG